MKKLIILIIALCIAVLCGLYIKDDPGYILLSYKNYLIELSLWTGIIIFLLSLLVIHKFMNLYTFVVNMPAKSKEWLQNKKRQQMYNDASQGLLKLAEGSYKEAYNLLIKSAKVQKKPLINYLTAAKAAQELGDISKRDESLKKAFEFSPKSGLSIGLMQANLQFANHEYEAALATLSHLKQKYGISKLVLKSLLNTYVNLKDWYAIIILIPNLTRYKTHSDQEILHYEILAGEQYFTHHLLAIKSQLHNPYSKEELRNIQKDLDDLFTKQLSKSAKYDYKLVIAYINCLNNIYTQYNNLGNDDSYNTDNKLINVLEKALSYNTEQKAQEQLLDLYVSIASSQEHFARLQKQLHKDSYNIYLLFTLGRITLKLNDFEKSYQYLNQAKQLVENSNNNDLPINYYLSYVLLKMGRQQECLELFDTSFVA